MAKKQAHQGSRLQNFIEKSPVTIVEILKQTGIAKSSLYDLFKKEELLQSKILPILELINIDADQFYGKLELNDGETPYGLKVENELLKTEIELLKKQLADKEEIIELLKSKRK